MFSINGYIFLHDKKIKSSEGVKYHCHCDRKSDEGRARVIVDTTNNGEQHFTMRKDLKGHAERFMDVDSRKFTEDLKKSARTDPEKSAHQVYDEVLTETLNSY